MISNFWFKFMWNTGLIVTLLLVLICSPALPAQASTQTDLHGPANTVAFGTIVKILPNGNVVVTDPQFKLSGTTSNAGAVFNGTTHGLISTLTGTHANDQVGTDIAVLTSGDFVVISPNWAAGTSGSATSAGAVTWCRSGTGCNGQVSASNSLVGNQINDKVGSGPIALLPSGAYVISSPNWANGVTTKAGAATWCSGVGGCVGKVSATNSLVGSQANDQVSSGHTYPLTNGNYVVSSPIWAMGAAAGAGAATWCSGAGGCVGPVATSNSLVGSHTNDFVANFLFTFENGAYFVMSAHWDNNLIAEAGAITWCSGTASCAGPVSASNSLVGSSANDLVGNYGITVLTHSNFVVKSANWSNNRGAATWCSGLSGCKGQVSAANSLTGSQAGDGVGNLVTKLASGAYVVGSPSWHSVGAATFCSHTTSACSGVVSYANSLTGSQAGDQVGVNGAPQLSNGNFLIVSPSWANGGAAKAGAVTWCPITTGCANMVVSPSNSLVGGQANDFVGFVTPLSNGNYVVASRNWANGSFAKAGAATWCSGAFGCTGTISPSTSLYGTQANDRVGYNIYPLKNGNYIVESHFWATGTLTEAGAVTWCPGKTGCFGPVSPANSLVGSHAGDWVGLGMATLPDDNYLVLSPFWANGGTTEAGAAIRCGGRSGCTGAVSPANSLVGSHANDRVGWYGVTILPNGDFTIYSPNWANNGSAAAGSVTLASQSAPFATGFIGPGNSVLGTAANGGIKMAITFDFPRRQLVVGRPADDLVTFFKPSFVMSQGNIYLPKLTK